MLLRQNKSCFHQIGRLGDGSSRGAARDKGGEEDVKKEEGEEEEEEEANEICINRSHLRSFCS